MFARPHLKVIIGEGNLQFGKENRRHPFVIVLPRMDDHFPNPVRKMRPNGAAQGRRFDDLRAGSNNRKEFQHYLYVYCNCGVIFNIFTDEG